MSSKRNNLMLTPTPAGGRTKRLNNLSMSPMVELALNASPIGPYVKAARTAYSLARTANAYLKSKGSAKNWLKRARRSLEQKKAAVRKARHRKWLSASTGFYKGNFRKPMRTNAPKVETLCLKKGYHSTVENYGTVTAPHCAYIQHSTYVPSVFAQTIAGALLRKLFKKAGIQMDNQAQELPLFSGYNADGFTLEYITYNPVNGVPSGPPTYTTVDDDSFDTVLLVKFPQLKDHIYNFLTNQSQEEPYALNLYSTDRNGVATNQRLAANLNLVNEFISLWSSSAITVQNRSAGDQLPPESSNADRYALERLDNVPLQGYIYQMSSGEPRLKYPITTPGGQNQMNYGSTDGIVLLKETMLVNDYQEPPNPKLWSTCVKSSRVILQPGEMKKAYILFKTKGKITNVLKYLRAERLVIDRLSGTKGKCQIIALEEKIRTDTANVITIQYERELKVGVTTRSGARAPITSRTSSAVKNLE